MLLVKTYLKSAPLRKVENGSESTWCKINLQIRVITKLPNNEQSSKAKGKTHKSINRQNQSTKQT